MKIKNEGRNQSIISKFSAHCRGMKLKPRIFGGDYADIQDFPWQLSFQENHRHLCGASILNERRALTAAHCFEEYYPIDEYSVIAGSSECVQPSENHINVSKYIVHPDFDNQTTSNDIAILWLAESFEFNINIHPVRIPEQDAIIPYGVLAQVAGWGKTDHHENSKISWHLKWIGVRLISNKRCNVKYTGEVFSNMVCAGWPNCEKDTLLGDSGGALVLDNTQIGIVSWARLCQDVDYPGVYTRVSSFTNWIWSVI